MAGIGHNSGETESVNGINKKELMRIINAYEDLQSQKDELGAAQKDLMYEAKGMGFDVKIIRILIRERKQDPQKLAELNMLVDVYRLAAGMEFLNDTDGRE